MDWAKQGDVLPAADVGDPDQIRAWQPWVIEEDDGTLRMWYSGHDGTTGRILEAVRPPGRSWQRVGTAVDAGLAGDSDRYGVDAACVVKVNNDYIMVYGGFDGRDNGLHLATSPDGHRWIPEGPILGRENGWLVGCTPSLFIGADEWWLFYSGSVEGHRVDGSEASNGSGGRNRTAILAAVMKPGGGWDPIGPVLEPELGEVATSHPCVVEISRRLYMFYASDNEQQSSVALATSTDGVAWERRGIALSTTDDDPDTCAVTAPCVVRLRDGSLGMWYSRRPWGDDRLAYTIASAIFPGPWPGST